MEEGDEEGRDKEEGDEEERDKEEGDVEGRDKAERDEEERDAVLPSCSVCVRVLCCGSDTRNPGH